MISLFRNFFQSKIGLPIFIGFLVIVALAFAASDISGSATFGGLSGDDNIAKVGDQEISANEMNGAVNNALDRARQQDPTIAMPQFVAQGGLESELELLIDRYAIGIFAQDYGLRAGDNLVNSEILKIGAFRNLTGEFDQATYQAALRRQGLTDAILRKDIGDGLLAQQILRPAFAAPRLPEAAARQYSALQLERRRGQIGLIPSSEYAPEGDPSDADLNTYYSENRSGFILPERRTIRFAAFGADSVNADITPTDEAIAARYQRDAEQYAASERRSISSFVVPTQAAAAALVERINSGLSLDAAAREAGFQVSSSDLRDRQAMASATSSELANAVFAAERGETVAPARSTLGFTIARVDDIERTPARTLAQVRDDISQQLRDEALAGALIDLSSRIEEKVDSGSSLVDVANEFGLEVQGVPNVTAGGRIFGTAQTIPQGLQPVLSTAFQMDESQPQLAEIVPGTQFLIFDVADITESAAPPISAVRDQVVAGWRRAEGNKRAKEAADAILAAVRSGTPMREAMREQNAALTQVEDIDMRSADLRNAPNGRVPAPLILLFSMASNSTKVLEDANDLGWYVVDLDSIDSDPVDENPQVLAQTRAALTPALIGEYNAQLSKAIRRHVGVTRNEEAIEALRKTLAGEN